LSYYSAIGFVGQSGSQLPSLVLKEAKKSNVSFSASPLTFAPMNDPLQDAIRKLAKGDTRLAESFFLRPGGRRYLENLSVILLHTLLPHSTEKEEMYSGFVQVLDHLEERILRQYEGEEILEAALHQPDEE
jgi:hypothetical protein